MLAHKMWNVQTPGHQPRSLHDLHHNVLLVPAVYSCADGHILLSTDPSILNLFQVHEQVPFILLHRSGFLRTLAQAVINLFCEGLNFQSIENFIAQQRLDHCTALAVQLVASTDCNALMENSIKMVTASQPIILLQNPSPSNDLIARLFLAYFEHNKHALSDEIQNITADTFMSFDHTFRVAANLGYLRSDGKWVSQYSSLFLVMNELGQVLSWQFTKSTSIDEVTVILQDLHHRLQLQQRQPSLILVDNCCNVRNKLQHIFGPCIKVKLDLFHATQRLTRHLPKRHPFLSACLADIKLLWRQSGDIGQKRTKATPAPKQILEQIDGFLTKWKGCEHNGWKLINDKVLVEIQALRLHARKGCLSDIPPSAGTNRNEALHSLINPHFRRCRMGLPLALALLALLIHRHNCSRASVSRKGRRTTVPLMLFKRHSTPDNTYKFGIIPKHGSVELPSWMGGKVHDNLTSLDEDSQILQYVTLSENVASLISISDMTKLLIKAVNQAHLAKSMQSASQFSPVFTYRLAPFMSAASTLLSLGIGPSQQSQAHKTRLNNVLAGWGLELFPMDPDGNCCFYSVAFSLISQEKQIRENCPTFFEDAGLCFTNNLKDLAQQLRKLVVHEWINHSCDYEGFLLSETTTVAEEAKLYLENGYFTGPLGNTMITALSNHLKIPIIIFSSIECHPVIVINPREVSCSLPILVAFNQHGSGHYDGVILKSESAITTSHTVKFAAPNLEHVQKCTCGCNDKTEHTHCTVAKTKCGTTTRCPCLQNNMPCTSQCRCRNCDNPNGKKKSSESHPQRKRPRYEWQKLLPKQNSLEFAASIGEDIEMGPRTMLEYFLLSCIYDFCTFEGIDTEQSMHTIYNAIVTFATNFEETLPITSKSEEDILKFLREREHNLEVFKALCYMQLSLLNLD